MINFALKEVNKRKKRYALNVLTISLVVILFIVMNSLNLAYKQASKLPFREIHSSLVVQKNGNVPENTTGAVLSCSMAPIENHYLIEITKIEGVKEVSSGLFLWVFDKNDFKRVLGLNWNDNLGKKIRSKIIQGSLPRENEVLIEKTYANYNNLKIDQTASISGVNFVISGIVETSGKDIVSSDMYSNIQDAQNIAFNSENLQKTEKFEKNDVNIIFIDADQTKISEISNKLNNLFNIVTDNNGKTPLGQVIGKYTISTPKSFESQISSFFVLSNKLIWIILLVTLIGSIVIIFQSTSQVVLERKKEFGVMKAVGFRNVDIKKEIRAEIFFQILIGFIIGLVLSYVLISLLAQTKISINIPWELNPYPHFLSSDPASVKTVQDYSLPIAFNRALILISFMIVFSVGFLTSEIILNRINKIKAMEILRYE